MKKRNSGEEKKGNVNEVKKRGRGEGLERKQKGERSMGEMK